ncbi:hypothetical protein [Paenibacillus gorillae]|uniref:hypothetical protein n=1 Tax=Paenibacillus gorillae TaxID=1243662 RepID=UPI0012DE2AEC|nr:hypothetical protein [Paenibacillus gorillae]
MIIKSQSGSIIHTLDWLAHALPTSGKKHLKDGHRANLELAKAWMTDTGLQIPSDLAEQLSTHQDTVDFQVEWAIPGFETKSDACHKLRGNLTFCR